MKKLLINICLSLSLVISAYAQPGLVSKPKLVIGIVVDQMRWDYLYRYADRFSQGGFLRLIDKGYNCQNTYLNYIPSYTAPGHSSIYTGTVPAIHGIVGNEWLDKKTYQEHYCASDLSINSVGGAYLAGAMSPRSLMVSTIGDELRLASNFKSRVFGVSLKDRGAIFPAGRMANAAFWLDDSTGNFISSSYYMQQLPTWLQHFNARHWIDTLLSEDWNTLYPAHTYKQSIPDDNPYEYLKKGEEKPVFPHRVSSSAYKQIRSLPAGNTFSFWMAEELIIEEHLGQKGYTDMLCLSLSSSDYIGHAYAPNAVEVEDMYLRLDRDLAKFFHFLDQQIGKGAYTIFLSADHGGAHNATFLQDHKQFAGLLSEQQLCKELNKELSKRWGSDSLIAGIINYQIVLREPLLLKLKIDRTALKSKLIQLCKAYPEIAYVVDLEHPADNMLPDFLLSYIRNGYYESRCGSIALIYQAAHYSGGEKGTTHGTWNPYDTHIPLLWYGWGISPGETYKKYEVTDIAATLAALLHIQVPNGACGKVIDMD